MSSTAFDTGDTDRPKLRDLPRGGCFCYLSENYDARVQWHGGLFTLMQPTNVDDTTV